MAKYWSKLVLSTWEVPPKSWKIIMIENEIVFILQQRMVSEEFPLLKLFSVPEQLLKTSLIELLLTKASKSQVAIMSRTKLNLLHYLMVQQHQVSFFFTLQYTITFLEHFMMDPFSVTILIGILSIGTFFFLNDLFLYLAIDTVFHPSGIIQNGRENFFKITCLKMF